MPDAAAEVLDQRAQRRPQRQLVVAGTLDMPAQAIDARPLALLRAILRIGRRAKPHDRRQAGDGLQVIDDRRAAIETDDRRERRLEAWIAALALQRLQQRALLAADVGSRAGMHGDLQIVAAAEDILSKQSRRVGFLHGALDLLISLGQFATDVDESVAHARGVGGKYRPLDDLVRADLHNHAVLEGARLTLVGVDAQIAWPCALFGQEAPLDAGGEARAAAPAQSRRLDLLGQLLRLEVAQRLRQRLVAAMCAVDIKLVDAWHVEGVRHDARVWAERQRLRFLRVGRVDRHRSGVLFRRLAVAATRARPSSLPS